MVAIYFLGGLGSNHFYVEEFRQNFSYDVTYLSLPGHDWGSQPIFSLSDLHTWYEKQVDVQQSCVLIGHSLGADLAIYLAGQYSHVQQLILLDGGFIDMERLQTLDEEIADAQTYLDSKVVDTLELVIKEEKQEAIHWSAYLEEAVKQSYIFEGSTWRLALDRVGISNLLRIRREAYKVSKADLTIPILLVLPDGEIPDWKKEMLESLPKGITLETLSGAGHSLYTDQPQKLASMIEDFLDIVI